MKPVHVITPRTDAEWPQDHPLRSVVQVMAEIEIRKLRRGEAVLVCSIEGEPRHPPEGDTDVFTTCAWCPAKIVHRASAPKNLTPICHVCYGALHT